MKQTLFTLSSLFFIGSAFAVTPGHYVYGGLGYSSGDFDFGSVENFFVADPNDSDATVTNHRDTDKSSLAFKLGFGYRYNEYFALEGSYAYLGKAKAKFEGTHETVPIGVTQPQKDFAGMNASMTAHVFAVDVLAIYPVNKYFEVFAKAGAGLAFTKTKGSEWNGYYSSNGDLDEYESQSFSKSKARFVPKLGVGVEWNATDKIAVRFEYERLFGMSKKSDYTVDADYDFVNVGIKYTF